jgi:acyl-CoA carboxylase subunit beta
MRPSLAAETAERTIELLTDHGTFVRANDDLASRDPLGWPGYRHALKVAAQRTFGDESIVAGRAQISGNDVEVAIFDFAFIAGSMGEVAGERLARALERAADRQVPFVLITSTGGARMQEGMVSLVQMPKVVVARMALAAAGRPLIAVLEHPTTGGVLASAAALADMTAAVDGATVGFAGPRVVSRFTGSPPPPSSHTAQSAFENGLVDALISRNDRKAWLSRAVSVFKTTRATSPSPHRGTPSVGAVAPAGPSRRSRAPELIDACASETVELRGDRAGGDDPAIIGVLARVDGRAITMIAFDGRVDPGPRAFRKATRALTVAARLDLPVVTLIDTRGADPSPRAESGGIAWAIGETLEALLTAPVPIIAIVTGDVLLAYESSIFSVIEPKAAAEILWRDATRAEEATSLLKLGAADLVELGIADGIIPDPPGPETLLPVLAYHLDLLTRDGRSGEQRALDRRRRWRGPIGSQP